MKLHEIPEDILEVIREILEALREMLVQPIHPSSVTVESFAQRLADAGYLIHLLAVVNALDRQNFEALLGDIAIEL